MERQALLDFGTGFFYYASERVKEAAGDNGIKYELPKIRFAEARSYDEEIRYSEIMYKAGIDELLLEGKKFRGKEDWISEMKSVLTPEEFSEKEILEKKLAAFSKGQYNYLTDEITIDNSLVEEIGIEHVLCHEILHSIRHQIRDYLGWDDEYSELISPGKAEFFSQLESVALESYGYRDGNEINPLNLDSLLREKAIFGKGSIRKKISEIKSAYLEAAGKNISKKRFEEQKSIDSGMSDAVKGINLKELIKEKEEMKMLYSAMEQFYNAKDYLMLLKGISEKSLRLLEAGLMSLNEIFGSFNLIFEEQKRLKKYNDALGFFREGLANIEDEMHYPDVRDDSSIPYLINTIAINENRNELRREWPKILSLDISEVEKRYIIPIKQEFKKIKRGAF